MDKKIPCQFETGRVNTIYPSPDILAFLSCLCQIARRKQSTPHIAFPSDHNIQYEKHTKQLQYVLQYKYDKEGDIKDANVTILNCFFHSSLHGYTLTTSSTFPDSSV